MWYTTELPSHAGWYRGLQAPWSPRHSLFLYRDLYVTLGPATYPQFGLAGGARYLGLPLNTSSTAQPAAAMLTSAIIYADVWVCTLADDSTGHVQCDWTPMQSLNILPRPHLNPERKWSVAASLPVPLVHVLSQAYHWAADVGVLFSGVSSRQVLQD